MADAWLLASAGIAGAVPDSVRRTAPRRAGRTWWAPMARAVPEYESGGAGEISSGDGRGLSRGFSRCDVVERLAPEASPALKVPTFAASGISIQKHAGWRPIPPRIVLALDAASSVSAKTRARAPAPHRATTPGPDPASRWLPSESRQCWRRSPGCRGCRISRPFRSNSCGWRS
jgi:hypothetical protein